MLKYMTISRYEIADVAVTMAGRKLAIFLPALHSGNQPTCFQENSIVQCMPLTIDAVQFAQHMLAYLLYHLYSIN